MHVGAVLVHGGYAVDGACHLTIDQDDPLVASAHVGQVFLGDEGLAEGLGEHLQQRGEILVALAQAEHARTAVAIERLQDDVAMLAAEGREFEGVAADQRLRHELRIVQHEELLRGVAHFLRIVDHQRLRMDRLQHVGGGDVAHVEGRVLAHEDHVIGTQIGAAFLAQREVIAGLVAHSNVATRGIQPAARQCQRPGLVVKQLMAAGLRLQHHGEGRVAPDVDRLDGVHLDGDLEGHVQSSP